MSIGEKIDHTLLKPQATQAQLRQLCREAAEHHFASVCVNPCRVALCAALLRGTGVKVCTVIGFPLGAADPGVKALEAAAAIDQGAEEVDMVLNIGAVKDGDLALAQADICGVVQAAAGRALVKVILETCLLTEEEKRLACRLAKEAGADFVKTSTGFSTGGATTADVALLRQEVGAAMGVKASGGIRDYATAKAMLDAGASRIGASAGVAILAEEKE